jgi:hypothetical protein
MSIIDKIESGFLYGLGVWVSLLALCWAVHYAVTVCKYISRDGMKEQTKATQKAASLIAARLKEMERDSLHEAAQRESLKAVIKEAFAETLQKTDVPIS